MDHNEIYAKAKANGCSPLWHNGILGWAWHCQCGDHLHYGDSQCSVIDSVSCSKSRPGAWSNSILSHDLARSLLGGPNFPVLCATRDGLVETRPPKVENARRSSSGYWINYYPEIGDDPDDDPRILIVVI